MLDRPLTAWLRPLVTFVGSGRRSHARRPAVAAAVRRTTRTPRRRRPSRRRTLLPTVITVYAGTPATLTISGGVAPYRAFSSDPTALPLPATVSGSTLVAGREQRHGHHQRQRHRSGRRRPGRRRRRGHRQPGAVAAVADHRHRQPQPGLRQHDRRDLLGRYRHRNRQGNGSGRRRHSRAGRSASTSSRARSRSRRPIPDSRSYRH